MRLAMRDLFRAFWPMRVQDEWTRAVLRNRPHLSSGSVQRTRRLTDENIDDASVSGYEHLIESITLPDAHDRHVLAAATHRGVSSASYPVDKALSNIRSVRLIGTEE